MSASGIDSVTSLNAGGAQTQSANGGIQVSSLSGDVSTMSSSYGGITCYKKACSTDYYLEAPSTSYFTRTSTTGTIGLTCYKATGCKSGYYNGGSSHDYHGFKCSPCTYSCPPGYSTSVTCGSGEKKVSAYKVKDQDVSTCPSSSSLCYKCIEDEKYCTVSNGYDYYKGYNCNTWSSYTHGECGTKYAEMATSAKCHPLIGSTLSEQSCQKKCGSDRDCMADCVGDCDVDSWRMCCEQCTSEI